MNDTGGASLLAQLFGGGQPQPPEAIAEIDKERTLPDVLSFDPSKPAKYPNGRVFADDVIDYRLAFLTKGEWKRYLSGAGCYLRARSLAYREQRLPVISRAVEDRFGYFWVLAVDCRHVISYPAHGFAGSLFKHRCPPVAEPFNLLAWCLAPHFDGNRAVRQGGWHYRASLDQPLVTFNKPLPSSARRIDSASLHAIFFLALPAARLGIFSAESCQSMSAQINGLRRSVSTATSTPLWTSIAVKRRESSRSFQADGMARRSSKREISAPTRPANLRM
jgi:hypothetical protein